ncbi:hypothetical protein OSTOST_15205 [Ostertagia ostertagi]
MSTPGRGMKKDAPSVPRGWSRRGSARASSQPQSQASQSRSQQGTSSPFVEPQITSSWAQQVQAENTPPPLQRTDDKTKKDKEGKKLEAEISSAIANLSVEKKKPDEEEMDTSDVVVVQEKNRVRAIKIPDKETTPARPSDFEAVARIVHILQTLLELVEHTTQSFHNLAVILVRRQPLDIRRLDDKSHGPVPADIYGGQTSPGTGPRSRAPSSSADNAATSEIHRGSETATTYYMARGNTHIPSSKLLCPPRLDDSPPPLRDPATSPQDWAKGDTEEIVQAAT